MSPNVLQELPLKCPTGWRVSISGEGKRQKYACSFVGKEDCGVCASCLLGPLRSTGGEGVQAKPLRIRTSSGRAIS